MAAATGSGFGDLLKRLRLAAGLTQDALAARAGVSERAVSDLERDPTRLPRLDTVILLAAALDLDASSAPSSSRLPVPSPARPPAHRPPCRAP